MKRLDSLGGKLAALICSPYEGDSPETRAMVLEELFDAVDWERVDKGTIECVLLTILANVDDAEMRAAWARILYDERRFRAACAKAGIAGEVVL